MLPPDLVLLFADIHGTPVNHNLQTIFGDSLQYNFNPDLPQLRAKMADDLSHTPVLIDQEYFRTTILEIPQELLADEPVHETSPFSDLESADDMDEKELSAKMVRISLFFVGYFFMYSV